MRKGITRAEVNLLLEYVRDVLVPPDLFQFRNLVHNFFLESFRVFGNLLLESRDTRREDPDRQKCRVRRIVDPYSSDGDTSLT